MRTICFLALCMAIAIPVRSQSHHTISGYISDSANGENLIGATVYAPGSGKGAVANGYGFYSLTLPAGQHHLLCRFLGFQVFEQDVYLNGDLRLDIELKGVLHEIDAVVVRGEALDRNVKSLDMSMARLDIKSITRLPSFAGEADVIKSLQFLPGVSAVGEAASGFNVRGGGIGQNLVLLDEAPVHQSSHMFGFFSVFNPDAVRDVKLYKGGIPAQFGGRLSSILDIRMKEGNAKKLSAEVGLGTIFSRISVEGPIKRDRASFVIAARRSYADILAKAFTDVLKKGSGLYFYDLTAKTNFTANEKNRIFLSGYFGRDVFKFDKFQGMDWGNRTATLRWNHVYGSRLFSNMSTYVSNYDYGFSFGLNQNDMFEWMSRILTYSLKPEFTWFPGKGHSVSFGGEAILYRFKPANTRAVSNGVARNTSLDDRRSLDLSLFVGNDHEVTPNLSVQYGLRFTHFKYLGGREYVYADTLPGLEKRLVSVSDQAEWEPIASFSRLEPRLSFRYRLSASGSIKGSYNRMNQFIHLISNTVTSTPIDIWQPSTNNIAPQQGDQVTLGYFRNFSNNKFETSAEVYYKWSRNQIDYIDGADLFVNEYLESQLLSGTGRAYGLELYAMKGLGRWMGWISYTIGRSELKVNGINYGNDNANRQGQWFPARYDQRHNLKIASSFDWNDRLSISANFTFLSGTPTTYPTDRITVQDYVIPYISGNKRNNIRIPDYHRLDLSLTIRKIWRGKNGRRGDDNLVLSVYNLYARKNPFSIYFSQGNDRLTPGDPVITRSTQLSIIGTLIPAISYQIKF